jgi:heat shock protein HslJ
MKPSFLVTFFIALICFSCGSSSNSNSGKVIQDPHAKVHQKMHNEMIQEEVQSEFPDIFAADPVKMNIPIFESDDPKAPLYRQKWEEGIVFYAEGNEPGWSFNLYRSDSLKFNSTNGLYFNAADVTPLPSIDPKNIDYRAVSEKGEMIIGMVENTSNKAMTEGVSAYTITISLTLKDQESVTIFTGLGDFIPDPQLSGNWIITKVDSLAVDPSLFDNKQPMLSIDLYKQKLSGNDGCNSFHGQVKFKVDKLIFGHTAGTLMACPNMEISQKIMNAIGGKSLNYAINDELILYTGDQKTMVLKRAE